MISRSLAVLGVGSSLVAFYGMVTSSHFVAAAGFLGTAAWILITAWLARRDGEDDVS